jgi:hypothetical protein
MNPLRGKMSLPADCWELDDFDWEPLSDEGRLAGEK